MRAVTNGAKIGSKQGRRGVHTARARANKSDEAGEREGARHIRSGDATRQKVTQLRWTKLLFRLLQR